MSFSILPTAKLPSTVGNITGTCWDLRNPHRTTVRAFTEATGTFYHGWELSIGQYQSVSRYPMSFTRISAGIAKQSRVFLERSRGDSLSAHMRARLKVHSHSLGLHTCAPIGDPGRLCAKNAAFPSRSPSPPLDPSDNVTSGKLIPRQALFLDAVCMHVFDF